MTAIVSNLVSYSKHIDNHTVDRVDLNRYMGVWYEIVRFDSSFEYDMDHVTATYSFLPGGRVQVVNQGYRNGKLKIARGHAKIADKQTNSKLKVSFALWFYADYFILELDQLNYNYVMVGSSSNKYLWILSRTPCMSNRDLNFLLRSAKTRGYDVNALVFCDQRQSTARHNK